MQLEFETIYEIMQPHYGKKIPVYNSEVVEWCEENFGKIVKCDKFVENYNKIITDKNFNILYEHVNSKTVNSYNWKKLIDKSFQTQTISDKLYMYGISLNYNELKILTFYNIKLSKYVDNVNIIYLKLL